MFEALGVRDFRLLWAARLISLLGTWLLVVAVPAHVFELTGSVAATGLTLAAEFLPPVVFGTAAGMLADRWDRRHVMVCADLTRALAVGLLLVPGSLWLVYLALAIESAGSVLFRPAAQAQTPAVVGTGTRLSSANALNASTDGVVRLIGGPLGGLLYGWAGYAPLVVVDVATYVVSAVAVLLTAAVVAAPRVVSLRGGLALISPVRALLLVNVLFLGANASLSALLIPYGMTVLGGSEPTGFLMSALGVGFLLGAPLTRLLVDRSPPNRLLACALAVTAAGYVLLFTSRSVAAALAAAVVIGLSGSTVLSSAQTTLQRLTPNEVMGRAVAVFVTGEAASALAGAIAGPAAAQWLSVPGAAVAAAALTTLSGVVALRLLPRQRPLPEPAAATPGALGRQE